MRKIEEITNEIFELDDSIPFFTNTGNTHKNKFNSCRGPKNIAVHIKSLNVWKEKLK